MGAVESGPTVRWRSGLTAHAHAEDQPDAASCGPRLDQRWARAVTPVNTLRNTQALVNGFLILSRLRLVCAALSRIVGDMCRREYSRTTGWHRDAVVELIASQAVH